jgi:hypothetical protein
MTAKAMAFAMLLDKSYPMGTLRRKTTIHKEKTQKTIILFFERTF